MKKIVFDEKLGKELVTYIRDQKQIGYAVDEDDGNDVELITTTGYSLLEFGAQELNKEKSKEEPTELTIGGLCSLILEYREGADESDGAWTLTMIPGEDLKKAIKDDDSLLDEDDE